MSDIGKRIKELRKRYGLSQQHFSDKIGYSRTYLSDIEVGKVEASRRLLESINNTFGVSFDSLIVRGLGHWVELSFKEGYYSDAKFLFLYGFTDKSLDEAERELLDFFVDDKLEILNAENIRSTLQLYSAIVGKKCTGMDVYDHLGAHFGKNIEKQRYLLIKNFSKSRISRKGLTLKELVKISFNSLIVVDKPSFFERYYNVLNYYARIQRV